MIKQAAVNGKTYNVAEASAVQQKTLLTIIGSRLALNLANDIDIKLDANFLVGALIGSAEPDFDKIASIVLYKTVENGGDQLVTVDDFQGDIMSYYLLVAEAVKINLDSFLSWLSDVRKPQAQPVAASTEGM